MLLQLDILCDRHAIGMYLNSLPIIERSALLQIY